MEQLELFKVEPDNRYENLRAAIRANFIINAKFLFTIEDVLVLSQVHRIIEGRVLAVIKEETEKYFNDGDDEANRRDGADGDEDDEDDDEDDDDYFRSCTSWDTDWNAW